MSSKTRYELEKFVPIALCNTLSLHLLKSYDNDQNLLEQWDIFIADTNGFVHSVDEEMESRSSDLKDQLDEKKLEDFSLELVATDFYSLGCDEEEGRIRAYVSTCWVYYDDLFRPRRYLIAFFQMTKQFEFERLMKSDVSFAPTYTKIRLHNGQLYWLIFGHSSTVRCYELLLNIEEDNAEKPPQQSITNQIRQLDSFIDQFPAFERRNIFGSLTKFDQLQMENLNFDLAGFDTGYLVASVHLVGTNQLLDRKLIKYNTPISIAMFINLGFVDQELYTVISSTIGPASVWALKFDHERQKLKWQVRCRLLESDKNDCVVSATVTGDSVLIGTFAEQLLFYSIKDTLYHSELAPMNQLNVGAPILAIAPFDIGETLLVLSTKGLQRYESMADDDSETTTNIPPSSNSSSPISTQQLASD